MRHGTFLRYVTPAPSSMKHRAALGAVALACGAHGMAPPPPRKRSQRGSMATRRRLRPSIQAGSGEFKASIHEDGTAIDYELTYRISRRRRPRRIFTSVDLGSRAG